MLTCNLAVLLAERSLRITKVSNDTGISRTTLTALASNYSQGIQFETINTLCMYLDITPNQLFEYVPVNITTDIEDFDPDFESFTLRINLEEKGRRNTVFLSGSLYISKSETEIESVEIVIDLFDEDSEDAIKDNKEIRRVFSMLAPLHLANIGGKITEDIKDELLSYKPKNANGRIKEGMIFHEDLKTHFSWYFLKK